MLSIGENFYHSFFPLNPFVAYGVNSICSIKIYDLFVKHISLFNLSKAGVKRAKRFFFCAMHITAMTSTAIHPTASTVIFLAACITSIAISRRLHKPRQPILCQSFTTFSSLPGLPREMIAKILSHVDENENPVSRFQKLAQIAQSNRFLYVAAQKERAKIINEHPEIATLEFFNHFEEMLHFAKTYGVLKLNLTTTASAPEALNRLQIHELITQLPNLTHLEISENAQDKIYNEVGDSCLQSIAAHLKNLSTLKINSAAHVSTEGIEALASIEKLTHLDIVHCDAVNDISLQKIITGLPNLTSLNVSGCKKITSAGMQSISSLKNLTHLGIAHCKGLDDLSLRKIVTQLTKLTSLRVGSPTLSKNGIQCITSLTHLTHLDLSGSDQLDASGLQVIVSHLSNLTKLNISKCRNITSAGILQIASLSNLTHLNLSYCRVNDTCLQTIGAHLTKLTDLSIINTNVSPVGIQALTSLINLETLSLFGCRNLNDASLQAIATHLTKLTSLNMGHCHHFTSTGLQALQSLPNLERLIFVKCNGVDDAGLKIICYKLKKLNKLVIVNCKNVNRKSIHNMMSLFPKIFIFFAKGTPSVSEEKSIGVLFTNEKTISSY